MSVGPARGVLLSGTCPCSGNVSLLLEHYINIDPILLQPFFGGSDAIFSNFCTTLYYSHFLFFVFAPQNGSKGSKVHPLEKFRLFKVLFSNCIFLHKNISCHSTHVGVLNVPAALPKLCLCLQLIGIKLDEAKELLQQLERDGFVQMTANKRSVFFAPRCSCSTDVLCCFHGKAFYFFASLCILKILRFAG